jgi:hypothetical protein
MKRLIMLLLLVALAIPATAFAVDSPGGGTCTFTTNDATKTMTLDADCTTDTTIVVPDGYTLDGKGHEITAVGPSGVFVGAVVENGGTVMHVKNLEIDGTTTALNNCSAFNGVAFSYASGSIKNVTLTGIGRHDGCQSGRAILVDAIGSATRHSVKIEDNTVSSYNKNGIDVRGNVDAKIVGNTVTGSGPRADIIQNGIVVRTGAFAQVWGNTVSGNSYTLISNEACGLLVLDEATVNINKQNALLDNDVPFYNGGSVVGKYSA